MKNVVKRFFKLFGLEVSRINKVDSCTNPFQGYDYADRGLEAVKLTQNNSMMPHINLFTLYEQAAYCEKENIRGAFVECGVWKGGAVGIMAKANMDFGKERRQIHLFDSFDDICPPVAEIDGVKAVEDMKQYSKMGDEAVMNGQLEPVKGFYNAFGGHGTINICKELLENKINYPSDYIHYHKGWFQDTLPVNHKQIDQIAILRLDGDWYDSVKICLDYLFEKVVTGGLVVIDDYGYYDGCTKAVDEFLEKKGIKTFLSYSSIGCRYFVKN